MIRTVLVGGLVKYKPVIRVYTRGIVRDGRFINREGPEFRFERIVDALIDRLLANPHLKVARSGLYRAHRVI